MAGVTSAADATRGGRSPYRQRFVLGQDVSDSSSSQGAPAGSRRARALDVAEAAKSLLTITEGKVVDFVDNTLQNKTPEEHVRQNIEQSLVFEYRFPREEISVEFRIKVGSLRFSASSLR